MADTTTTLNVGVGGDVMDESLVTQASGTTAKRPRVVPGGDDGSMQSFTKEDRLRTAGSVVDYTTNKLLLSVYKEVRRLRLITMFLIQHTLAVDLPAEDDLDDLEALLDSDSE